MKKFLLIALILFTYCSLAQITFAVNISDPCGYKDMGKCSGVGTFCGSGEARLFGGKSCGKYRCCVKQAKRDEPCGKVGTSGGEGKCKNSRLLMCPTDYSAISGGIDCASGLKCCKGEEAKKKEEEKMHAKEEGSAIVTISTEKFEGDFKMPGVEVPDMKIPDIKMPDMKMHDVKMPGMKIPDMKMPDIKMPDMKIPDMKMPDIGGKLGGLGDKIGGIGDKLGGMFGGGEKKEEGIPGLPGLDLKSMDLGLSDEAMKGRMKELKLADPEELEKIMKRKEDVDVAKTDLSLAESDFKSFLDKNPVAKAYDTRNKELEAAIEALEKGDTGLYEALKSGGKLEQDYNFVEEMEKAGEAGGVGLKMPEMPGGDFFSKLKEKVKGAAEGAIPGMPEMPKLEVPSLEMPEIEVPGKKLFEKFGFWPEEVFRGLKAQAMKISSDSTDAEIEENCKQEYSAETERDKKMREGCEEKLKEDRDEIKAAKIQKSKAEGAITDEEEKKLIEETEKKEQEIKKREEEKREKDDDEKADIDKIIEDLRNAIEETENAYVKKKGKKALDELKSKQQAIEKAKTELKNKEEALKMEAMRQGVVKRIYELLDTTGHFDITNLQVGNESMWNITDINETGGDTNIIHRIIRLLGMVLGTAGVLTLVISGIMMIISHGDENLLQSGKTMFIYTLLALIVGFTAYIIVQFVISFVFNVIQ